ncbi:hypothetical protein [Blastococcus sp. VKM Ac-2987]|uniref:hypothetical protein n=1 Tax=Blastococcus sp. VKM Ac-2987 TaxID=3004141 RepID=UPI0022ABB631|nr:hypothetical protein [Blastococcus sp. VKM Ac-2987]MCZ2857031.1 hypothetical protein [Blastococcus sp. VKM Ac-2987]
MDFGLILVVLGGFLLGGAWSIWRADSETGRTGPQVVFAGILLAAALLATASGILRLV